MKWLGLLLGTLAGLGLIVLGMRVLFDPHLDAGSYLWGLLLMVLGLALLVYSVDEVR